MSDLSAYLEIAEREQKALRATNSTDSRARRVLKHAAPPRWRGRARMLATDIISPLEGWRAKRLAATGPLLLHLGSGPERKAGWVNIDLVGDPVDLSWNLARPLPFQDGVVDGIFHEHLLEHLPLAVGTAFTRECARVLRPGGTLRIGVPDIGALIADYASGKGELLARKPGRPTALLALQEMFYWHRHCTMYDFETLDVLVRWAGFKPASRSEWGRSAAFDPAPDSERRRVNTLYIEAVGP